MVRTLLALLIASSALSTSAAARAQADKIFDKSYPLNGRPDLHVDVDNTPIHAQRCDSCREIHIHVDARDMSLSDFHIEQSQNGNAVRFSMKQRSTLGWHLGNRKGPEVTISLPAQASLALRSSNGAIDAAGFQGDIDLRTDNGALDLHDSEGNLHATSENGRVNLQHVSGSVTAHSENGSIEGDGRLTRLEAQTDNGTVRMAVTDGSTLSSGVKVTTGNGSVRLRLPQNVHANVDLRSGLGSVTCNLQLAQTSSDDHHVQGSLNGGGPAIQVETGNGSIHVGGQ